MRKFGIILLTICLLLINVFLIKDILFSTNNKSKINKTSNNKIKKLDEHILNKKTYIKKDILKNRPIKKVISKKFKNPNNCSINKIEDTLLKKFEISQFPIYSKYKTKIAIIDTGLDYKNKAFHGKTYLPNKFKKNNSFNFGMNFVNNSTEPFDSHGHGSHIAGLILAINPNVELLPLKYYKAGASGTVSLKRFKQALRFAIDNNVDIINISGGGPEPDDDEKNLIIEARKKGILIVSALGNERSNINNNPYYPAYYQEQNLLNVMAHDDLYRKPAFSNWGDFADISTFGKSIISFGVSSNNRCLFKLNGTSQSTAIITGIASIIKNKNPNISFSKIKKLIKMSSRKSRYSNLSRIFDFKKLSKILD